MTALDSGASLRLAEATTKDSKSMKAIAIMTMFFLPATSIAAVLSVSWDQSYEHFSVAQVAAFVTVTVICDGFCILHLVEGGGQFGQWKK